jgi:hypothetical protein
MINLLPGFYKIRRYHDDPDCWEVGRLMPNGFWSTCGDLAAFRTEHIAEIGDYIPMPNEISDLEK